MQSCQQPKRVTQIVISPLRFSVTLGLCSLVCESSYVNVPIEHVDDRKKSQQNSYFKNHSPLLSLSSRRFSKVSWSVFYQVLQRFFFLLQRSPCWPRKARRSDNEWGWSEAEESCSGANQRVKSAKCCPLLQKISFLYCSGSNITFFNFSRQFWVGRKMCRLAELLRCQ